MKTGILMNGATVKNHISSKTGFGNNAIRRTSFLLWFQACQVRLQDLIRQLQGPVQVSTSVDDRSGQPDKTLANNPQKNK